MFSIRLTSFFFWHVPLDQLMPSTAATSALDCFHPGTRDWFRETFQKPTRVQEDAWPAITEGQSALLLAPTGSGKTLAAFLVAIDRLFFQSTAATASSVEAVACPGVRVLYISPLKALAVDVDRNLREPIAGLRKYAESHNISHYVPQVAVRSGDTPQKTRAAILRNPPDILITTPESLYLMLTSKAETVLAHVETVIVDEIHAVAGTKRGSHLFSTLERLERLRTRVNDSSNSAGHSRRPLQRIGLSATQRPLEEIAQLLGGGDATADPSVPVKPRAVKIVDASAKRQFALTIETPAEEQADPIPSKDDLSSDTLASPAIPSVWPSIQPRLVELIREHRSTMIFVNSRRLAERLATAINELAEEELALAHHGSVARETRAEIEDRLKRGDLRAMVATSSMELGIDMGSIDLVIQIEAPPSIASGIQRIGRAGHQVGAVSTGVIFPKYRGDLVACSAAVGAMLDGWVESTHYPRNPLDVLAQQIVAMTSREAVHLDDLYRTLRCAAPYFELPKSSFLSVMDLLSGRYPSDEFSELRPRVNWDRFSNLVSPRKGAQRLAILNGGTIPDRGLYGVFLIGTDGESGGRVGELDEEMVFECLPGDVFLLGASSWRVMDITRDRVMVLPAPGEPGRMPFWRGEGPGRPLEFGRAIGKLSRELVESSQTEAVSRLKERHGMQTAAAQAMLQYLNEQRDATGELPSDRTVVVECFPDEIGDWRIVLLSPFGSRVHAPWALLVAARLRRNTDVDIDVTWTDDGIVFRVPETHELPPLQTYFPDPDDVEEELLREIGGTALFAAKFRENAARSLLLPRQYPGRRTPLWLQRRRSGDLLKVASRFRSFPLLLETYRECLRDVFDMTGFVSLLTDIKQRTIRIREVRSAHPSPYSGAVLFHFAGHFLYENDAPLAERRAQTLALDHAQLRELLGTVDLRTIFDEQIVKELNNELQRLKDFKVRHPDDLHGLLLDLGSLTKAEILLRCEDESSESGVAVEWLRNLEQSRRVFSFAVNEEKRFAVSEDAGKLRDALGIEPPSDLPPVFLEDVEDAVIQLVAQYARTHAPFHPGDVAARLGIGIDPVLSALSELASRDRAVEGEFLPGRSGQEWCDTNVLRRLKRRSLAALRQDVEPVAADTLVRFLPDWHGITRPRSGLDGILDVVEQLQGAPLPASTLESEILPARIDNFRASDLDQLFVQQEIIWRGFDSTGSTDGRVGLYLTDDYLKLAPSNECLADDIAVRVRLLLRQRGALFFDQLTAELHQFPNDLLSIMWEMVWNGELTNDTLTPLRSLRSAATTQARSERRGGRGFRTRRQSRLPGSEGRWSLLPTSAVTVSAGVSIAPTATERQMAIAAQLIERHGVLTREMLTREEVAGGFAGLYPVLKAMEEAGRVRRGYFVSGLGVAQFAAPGAEDRLRDFRSGEHPTEEVVLLAATDPASPWGNALRWPETPATARPQRVAGARVIVVHGCLAAYWNRTGERLITFLPAATDLRAVAKKTLAGTLARQAEPGASVLLTRIDGQSPAESELSRELLDAGFAATAKGYLHKGFFNAPE